MDKYRNVTESYAGEATMSTNSFPQFIKQEIEAVHKNIDRLKSGMQRYSDNDSKAAGMQLVLNEQVKQLQFLEQMQREVRNFDRAMGRIREMLIATEKAHQKAADRDLNTNQPHSVEWWETLHQIEYLGEFIRRIHAWQTEFVR